MLGAKLAANKFHPCRKHQWTRQNAAEIVAIVELQHLRGAATARWGCSLGFVPHVDKDFRIAWHRTERAARFDLSYDPLDYEQHFGYIDQLSTSDRLAKNAGEYADWVASASAAFLDPIRDLPALLHAFEEKRTRSFIRLGFEHYPQELLAYAFVLARCGRMLEAEQALQRAADCLKQFGDFKAMPDSVVTDLAVLLGTR
jgi:hypothetical protein